MTPAARRILEAECLHRGGSSARWGSLGLWPAEPATASTDYASACAALADAVAEAAGGVHGLRLLALGCGAGEELMRWVQAHGARSALGIEADPDVVATACRGRGVRVLQGSALAPPPAADGPFDAVLAVDAAYHFAPRAQWLRQARLRLRPGSRLAFTDLVLDPRALPRPVSCALLALPARASGIAVAELLSVPAAAQRLRDAGFTDVHMRSLDDEVLGGFVRFVQRQQAVLGADARGLGWQRVTATARMLPLARALGLGCVLFSAMAAG